MAERLSRSRLTAADVEAVKARFEKTVTTFGGWMCWDSAGTAIPKPFEEATQRRWTS